ncbi:hypothetical protein BDW75DRAFT_235418 [Aspergillus navahoensis]
MSPKRQRTVAGSCWQRKTRRVKCDLTSPECRKCLVSGASCSYGRLRVRWSSRPAKDLPPGYQLEGAGGMLLRSPLTQSNLAEHERKALEYFQFVSRSVLLSMCELAEARRAGKEERLSPGAEVMPTKRLNCLTSVRKQLEDSACDTKSLSHRVGVRAIIENLGGFCAFYQQDHSDVHMLLSQFALTDLTRVLLDDRPPCLPASIWLHIEHSITTLASIFHSMAEMAFYRQSLQEENCVELSMEQTAHLVKESGVREAVQPLAFARAFEHSALIYLYRAICGLPARHFLVQQHAHNCIVFPLYVAGAHVFHAEQQRFIMHKLDDIYQALNFDSLLSIRTALEDLWLSPQQEGSWAHIFSRLGQDVLVL